MRAIFCLTVLLLVPGAKGTIMDKTYAKKLAGVALLGLATIAANVQAAEQTVCAGTGGKFDINGGKGASTASNMGFFAQGFTAQCSNNVLASYSEESASQYLVAAGSKKGNMSFYGTSNGGGVVAFKECSGTNKECTAGDVTAAIAEAKTK